MLKEKKKIQPYPNPTCVWTPHLQPQSNFLSDCVYVCEGEMTITATQSESPLLVFYFIK